MALQFNASDYYAPWAAGRQAEVAGRLDPNQLAQTLLQAFSMVDKEQSQNKEKGAEIKFKLAKETNLTPEQINAITNEYIKTGNLNLPSQAGYGPMMEPFKFKGDKKEGILTFNQDTGKLEIPNIPGSEGYSGFKIADYSPAKANLYSTGAQTKVSNSKDAKGMTTETLRNVIKDAQDNLQTLIPGTPEHEVAMQELAPFTAELNARLNRSSVQGQKPQEKTTSKALTPELAKKFLQQANGDRDKARALAKQAGYSF